MKVMTILGTRPEIIRLTQVVQKLDQYCDHVLVHTGQNFDPKLNDIFFQQLSVRPPDHYLGVRGETFGDQIGKIIAASEEILAIEKPDLLLLLGDTNSALSALVAKRLGIPVYHMEAGNRCYDDRVPEEVNRRVIDHCSDVLMPYTERSRQNLLREGIEGERVYVIGNPIYEVLKKFDAQITASQIHAQLGVDPCKYFLVTMHRAENVDVLERLHSLLTALDRVQREYQKPVVISAHPHTRQRITAAGIHIENDQLRFLEPFGFFDFVSLERNAFCVISDSGTVQEECCIFKVPNVTIRDVTERPETLECGSNVLSGAGYKTLLRCVGVVISQRPEWKVPPEYVVENVSDTVTKLVLGYRLK